MKISRRPSKRPTAKKNSPVLGSQPAGSGGVRAEMLKRARELLKNERYPDTPTVFGLARKLAGMIWSERN
jgi:hypothetical protein